MKVLTILHQRNAGPGVFADAAAGAGHELVEWLPAEGPPPSIEGFGAAMVFGGAMHVDQEQAHPWLAGEKQVLRALLGSGMPLLGVCLGSQLLAGVAGAQPGRAREPEIGWLPVELDAQAARDPVLGPLSERFEAFQWHSYEAPLPPGATALAWSPVCLQAFRVGAAWGVQFHAEVTREIIDGWLDDWRSDDDAVASGLDPEAIRAEGAGRMDRWNELGRGICARFLAEAERRAERL